MPRSMTGFGAGRAELSTGSASVEIRTVNHRHLDVRWHGVEPPELIPKLEGELKRALGRGRVDVRLHGEGARGSRAGDLDEEAVRRRVGQVRRLAGELELEDDLKASALLSLGALVSCEDGRVVRTEEDVEGIRDAFRDALAEVVQMRRVEGAQTSQDLEGRLGAVSRLLDRAAELRVDGVELRRDRLRARVTELLEGRRLDEDRLAQELAMLADRSDVSEELERARGHVRHFAAQLRVEGAVGRKLEFLVQELGREVNTMGSKAHELSEIAVELKSELEKLREQVQNLE
jgi:uncharacterized protein (TIGR00255 family)